MEAIILLQYLTYIQNADYYKYEGIGWFYVNERLWIIENDN